MYKRHLHQMSMLDDPPEVFGGVKLNPENEWVKKAKRVPWAEQEVRYADLFPSDTGHPAYSVRIAVGALLITERYPFPDGMTVERIPMNPHPHYFVGLGEFASAQPFSPCWMARFRQRVTPEMLSWVNGRIIGRPEEKGEGSDKPGDGEGGESGEKASQPESEPEGTPPNEGTLLLDAACAPQNLRFSHRCQSAG